MNSNVVPTVEDLRSEIGRRRVVLYRLASVVSIHPSRLSLYLNGHLPLSPELALRILQGLQSADVTKVTMSAEAPPRPRPRRRPVRLRRPRRAGVVTRPTNDGDPGGLWRP